MNIEDFARWMTAACELRRAEAASALGNAYFHRDVPPAEKARILNAMALLTEDDSVVVRRALAEALAGQENIPKLIAAPLLSDVAAVALPLIARSPGLGQGELMTAATGPNLAVASAVAGRADLSPALVSAIARHGLREAVLALLANARARISELDFADIVQRLGEDADIRGALTARDDMPAFVRHTLVARVSEDLKQLVDRRAWMTPERSRRMMAEMRDRAAVNVASAINSRELRNYVATLKREGRITPAFLIRALASGPEGLLEVALAELGNLPVARVADILEAGTSATILALFEKARMPERLRGAFAEAIEARVNYSGAWGAIDRPRRTTIILERLMTACEGDFEDDIDDLVSLLRRLAMEAVRETARGQTGTAGAAPQPEPGEEMSGLSRDDLRAGAPASGRRRA